MAGLISRQHETTRVSEVEGQICADFRAVYDHSDGSIGPLYLLIDERWHRFYLDAGVLFWQEGQAPEPENDLLDEDVYLSLAEELCVRGARIRQVEMDNCELLIVFENKARIRIFCDVQSPFPVFRERTPGVCLEAGS